MSKGMRGSGEKNSSVGRYVYKDPIMGTCWWSFGGAMWGGGVRKRKVTWNEVTDLKSHQTWLNSVVQGDKRPNTVWKSGRKIF